MSSITSQPSVTLQAGEIAILFINNEGGGYAGPLAVTQGTTVGDLFRNKMRSGANPDSFLIRVNRNPADMDQVLNSEDKVSITPTKIEGAAENSSQPSVTLQAGEIAILFINNEGGGYAGPLAVTQGTTVGDLFRNKMRSGANPDSFLIRVNRNPADMDQVLNSEDKVSITPTKIEGAHLEFIEYIDLCILAEF